MNVLVIGASRGIGLEFVRQYCDEGARVIATARDDAGLARLQALGATAARLDVTDTASVSALAWLIEGEPLDLALYVAGVYVRGDARQPPGRAEFDHALHTNVLGAMQAIPQVAPQVEAAQGRFVFVSSEMGRIGDARSSHGWTYRVSKAALNMAVVAAQPDYPGAVMVCINPGWVRTDMGGERAPLSAEHSVAAMRHTIATLGPQHRGTFVNHDGSLFNGW